MDTHSPTPADEWITLTERFSIKDIDSLRLHLESNDITVFIPDESMMTTHFGLFNGVGGFRLQVPKAKSREAYALMKEWEASLLLVNVQCPACHSHHAGYAPSRWNPLLVALSLFFLGGVILMFFDSYQQVRLECRNCKHTWKVSKKSLKEPTESTEEEQFPK